MNDDPEARAAADADRLFDATVRQMLKAPPKPHEDMKLGQPKRKAKARPVSQTASHEAG